jgi:antitoxin MazE
LGLYELRVIKIGNCLGITLPTDLLKQVGLAQGDDMQIEVVEGDIVLRKKEQLTLPEGFDAEFTDILNDVMKEHDQAFKGLVDK